MMVDDKAHGMVMHKRDAGHACQYVKRAVNRDGYDGQLQFISQLECTFVKRTHTTGIGA